ncbi:hypothetical protein SLEP1_g53000 [Rubroshorea leprosula]|uniref:Uncharacterized protein n=1 Tax=Rubroshorea leprosula TaxID=152421 RepID=A0AAV5M8U8_9ROSI|nr:hypothetical protein SLEP1_g53000 [Rubroshorea leprosula]
MAHERWNTIAGEMASWLQARLELNCHKDELKQVSSCKVVYLIQMEGHEDELKRLSSSESELIRGLLPHLGSFASSGVVHLGLGCHKDELKHRLSSFEVVYLIRGCSPDYHEDEIKQLSSSEVYLIQGSSPQNGLARGLA